MTLVPSDTSPLYAARVALAAALQTAIGFDVHHERPAGFTTPCVVLEPDGWEPLAGGPRDIYRVRATCLYASKDEADMTNAVEELARLTYVAAKAAGWKTPDVPAPGSVVIGTGEAARTYAGVQFQLSNASVGTE